MQQEIVKKMMCRDQLVFPQVLDLIEKGHEEDQGLNSWHYALIVGCVFTFLIIVAIGSYVTHRRVQTNKLLKKKDWDIPIEDIIFYTTSKSATTGKSR